MTKKLAELKVIKSADYKNEVIEALEDAGFEIVIEENGLFEGHYIIAKKIEDE